MAQQVADVGCNGVGCVVAFASLQEEIRQLKAQMMGTIAENKRLHGIMSAHGWQEATPSRSPDEVTATEVAMMDEGDGCAPPAQPTCAPPAQVTCAPPAQKAPAKPAGAGAARRKRKGSPIDPEPGPRTAAMGRPNAENGAAPRRVDGAEKPAAAAKGRKGGKYVPGISVYSVDVRSLTDELRRFLGHREFSVRLVNKTVTNVQVGTIEEFEKLRDLFKERGTQFFTYTPRDRRPYSAVIVGLSDSFEEDDLRGYLDGLDLNLSVQRVANLGHNKWLVHLNRTSDVQGFYNLRTILHCRVSIRKDRKSGLIQCHNCQRFGHTSSNCGMPFRCVKCAGDHGPGKCAVPSKGAAGASASATDAPAGAASRAVDRTVKCANCNRVGHVASSKECPKRQALVAKKNEVAERRASERTSFPLNSGRVRGGMSYAAAARSNPGPRGVVPQRNASTVTPQGGASVQGALAQFELVNSDCARFFGRDFMSCLSAIKGFAKGYAGLTTEADKSHALLGLLLCLNNE